MQHLTDKQVMLEYQRGEAVAMDELLRRFKNPVYHFAYRLSYNAAEAQEITQEVFLRLHEHRANYSPTGKFSTWIFTIAHNVFVSRWRKNRRLVLWPRKSSTSDEPIEVADPDPIPNEAAQQNEMSQIIRRCVQTLPFPQKEALLLREFGQMDYDEIATILNKSLGTVKTLIHRARINLKKKLLPYIKELGGYNV
ncbi:RNA polymerase sigma factor [Candidatus Omnitrophota bacterium]